MGNTRATAALGIILGSFLVVVLALSAAPSVAADNLENTPSSLIISPSSFTVDSGGSVTFTVTLTSSGVPLSGELIDWQCASGTLSFDNPTDENGQVEATWYLPTVTSDTIVAITAYFRGDDNLYIAENSATASGTITVPENTEVDENDLIAYWSFNEGTGSIAYDNTAYGDNGTISGATWNDGGLNGSLTFDGVNDHISVSNSTNLEISNSISVEAWIYRDSQSRDEMVVSKRSGETGFALWFYWGINKALFNTGNTDFNAVCSTTDIQSGVWYHIVGTYDGTVRKIYVNGVLENSVTATGQLSSNTANLEIGKYNLSNTHYFDGAIDEVKIYDRALTAEEVYAHYGSAFEGYPPPIIIIDSPENDSTFDNEIEISARVYDNSGIDAVWTAIDGLLIDIVFPGGSLENVVGGILENIENGTIIDGDYFVFDDGTIDNIPTEVTFIDGQIYEITIFAADNEGFISKSTVYAIKGKRSAALQISPSSFVLESENTLGLTATLTSYGQPLAGKTVNWYAGSGDFSSASGTTNSLGQVSVMYTSPSVSTTTALTIGAYFAGDNDFLAASGNVSGNIYPNSENGIFEDFDGENWSTLQSQGWNYWLDRRDHDATVSVDSGTLYINMYAGANGGSMYVWKDANWVDHTVSFDWRPSEYWAQSSISLILRADNVGESSKQGIFFRIVKDWSATYWTVFVLVDTNGDGIVEEYTDATVNKSNLFNNTTCHIEARILGNNLKIFGDNALWADVTDNKFLILPAGGLAFVTYEADLVVDNLAVSLENHTYYSSELSVSPPSFELQSVQQRTITATLTSGSSPLQGRTINWSTSSGWISSSSTTTDSQGQATVTYTAPAVASQTSVTVQASFVGDAEHSSCSATSLGTIFENNDNLIDNEYDQEEDDGDQGDLPPSGGGGGGSSAFSSTLSLSLASTTLDAGDSITITATLKDTVANSPLSDRSITWEATGGSLSAYEGLTNSQGRMTVTFTAPNSISQASLVVTATFSGSSVYLGSTASATILVVGKSENVLASADNDEISDNTPADFNDLLPPNDNVGPVENTHPYLNIPTMENFVDNLKQMMDAMGLPIADQEEILQVLRNAISDGKIGASVSIGLENGATSLTEFQGGVKVEVTNVTSGEMIELKVSSDTVENGSIILINIGSDLLSSANTFVVLYDGVGIGLADDYADIIDSQNENVAEYIFVTGANGVQILISIPHFSTHSITISSLPTQPVADTSPWVAAALGIVVATALIGSAWLIYRRFR